MSLLKILIRILLFLRLLFLGSICFTPVRFGFFIAPRFAVAICKAAFWGLWAVGVATGLGWVGSSTAVLVVLTRRGSGVAVFVVGLTGAVFVVGLTRTVIVSRPIFPVFIPPGSIFAVPIPLLSGAVGIPGVGVLILSSWARGNRFIFRV
ncbi:hypothetical protein BZA77DRAFT_308248 [Pyronema omphalodes]|nr:hypothetical protein BZA77DRAFT_308248 [Pyronema omphalodes]